jgi:2-aminoadipate transaminase
VGWIAAERPILDKLVIIKQAADLHSSTLDQMITSAYMDAHDIEKDLAEKRKVYRDRRDAMLRALESEMPPGVNWSHPRGGLFLWLELPDEVDSRRLLRVSLSRGVAFVPGDSFFPTTQKLNTMRLNYSCMPEDRIAEGIRRLGVAIKEMMAQPATVV